MSNPSQDHLSTSPNNNCEQTQSPLPHSSAINLGNFSRSGSAARIKKLVSKIASGPNKAAASATASSSSSLQSHPNHHAAVVVEEFNLVRRHSKDLIDSPLAAYAKTWDAERAAQQRSSNDVSRTPGGPPIRTLSAMDVDAIIHQISESPISTPHRSPKTTNTPLSLSSLPTNVTTAAQGGGGGGASSSTSSSRLASVRGRVQDLLGASMLSRSREKSSERSASISRTNTPHKRESSMSRGITSRVQRKASQPQQNHTHNIQQQQLQQLQQDPHHCHTLVQSKLSSNHQFQFACRLEPTDELFLHDIFNKSAAMFYIIDARTSTRNSILYISPAYLEFTEYRGFQVRNREWELLQGQDDHRKPVKDVLDAVKSEKSALVTMKSFKSTGEMFRDQFFITPLRGTELKSTKVKTFYYACISCDVTHLYNENSGKLDSIHNIGYWLRQNPHPNTTISAPPPPHTLQNPATQTAIPTPIAVASVVEKTHHSPSAVQFLPLGMASVQIPAFEEGNFLAGPGRRRNSEIHQSADIVIKSTDSKSPESSLKQADFSSSNPKKEKKKARTFVQKAIVSDVDPTVSFIPKAPLIEKDAYFVKEMLSNPDVIFCITDPSIKDNPIVFASKSFLQYTGFDKHEVIGNNCRFLQGEMTEEEDIMDIRKAIRKEKESVVCLVNYRKDGRAFLNQFYISPLKSKTTIPGGSKTSYFIGVQCECNEADRNEIINYGSLFRAYQDIEDKALVDDKVMEKYKMKNVNMLNNETKDQIQTKITEGATDSLNFNTSTTPAAPIADIDEDPHLKQEPLRRGNSLDDQLKKKLFAVSRSFVELSHRKVKPIVSINDPNLVFKPDIRLCRRDIELIQVMLNRNESFCITDPKTPDHVIIYASKQFIDFTEYEDHEIIGKNCRFLQGQGTDPEDVQRIRDAIKNETDTIVNIVNYTKSRTEFVNQFYITPLKSVGMLGKLETRYFIGIQCNLETANRNDIMNFGRLFREMQMRTMKDSDEENSEETPEDVPHSTSTNFTEDSPRGSTSTVTKEPSKVDDGAQTSASGAVELKLDFVKSRPKSMGTALGRSTFVKKLSTPAKEGLTIVSRTNPSVSFTPKRRLTKRDTEFIQEMMDSDLMFVISDPSLPDNELVFVSRRFLDFTGYAESEILGRNCRFLQGPATEKEDVNDIRRAIKEEKETVVFLMNYTKSKKLFKNQFFLSPLKSRGLTRNKTCYFIGVQCDVADATSQEEIVNYGKLFRDRQPLDPEESEFLNN